MRIKADCLKEVRIDEFNGNEAILKLDDVEVEISFKQITDLLEDCEKCFDECETSTYWEKRALRAERLLESREEEIDSLNEKIEYRRAI